MSDPAAPGRLQLSCRPGKAGAMLVFAYTVENPGPGDLYVMDATPSIDPATRQPKADDQAAVVMLGPGDDAIIGKFIAPLPATRRVAMPVIPLAVRLLPGAMLDRRLEVPLPLAEISPYFADLPLRRYQPVDIKGVRFTIGYWDANAEGVAAAPAAFAPGLVAVVTRAPMRAATCTQRFPTTGLQLFKRTDDFPRLAE